MNQNRKVKNEGKYSIEMLTHFQCCKCNLWWTIGDAPKKEKWYCPWCGHAQNFKQVDPNLPLIKNTE